MTDEHKAGVPVRKPCFLVVCATAMELRSALHLLPGGPGVDLKAFEQGARLDVRYADLPLLPMPGSDLRLLVCGVGPVAAALTFGRISAQGPMTEFCEGVCNFGLAGSYDPDAAPPGSIVLAEREYWPEYGVWPEADEKVNGNIMDTAPGLPAQLHFAQGLLPSGPIFSRLELDPDNTLGNMGLNCHTVQRRGTSVTMAAVSGTRRRAGRMAALSGGLTENMEGFALALGARAAGLPFVEIRAVSNVAGRRPPDTWDMPGASQALAEAASSLFKPFIHP